MRIHRPDIGIKAKLIVFGVLSLQMLGEAGVASPIGTAFTYQGRLSDGGGAPSSDRLDRSWTR